MNVLPLCTIGVRKSSETQKYTFLQCMVLTHPICVIEKMVS